MDSLFSSSSFLLSTLSKDKASSSLRDLLATVKSPDSLWATASASSSSLCSESALRNTHTPTEDRSSTTTPLLTLTSPSTDLTVGSMDQLTTATTITTFVPAPLPPLPSELILYIFKFLQSAHDLRSSILVCRLWCSCGIDLLWSRPTLMRMTVVESMVQTMSLPCSTTLFPYADYIRRLNLSFVATDLTDSILECFSSCTRLERLLLPGAVKTTEEALRRLISKRSSWGLVSLDLSEMGGMVVTDELVEHVARQCPRLHTLYLGACPTLTDEAIVHLARHCPFLKRIKLSQCVLLTDRAITALIEHCPNLIEIDVTNCHLMTDNAVQSVFQTLPQIRDLNITLLTNISNLAFEAIHPSTHRFEQLRVLNLTSCVDLTDETLVRIIPAAPRLRSLALTKCDKITDTGASVIKTLGKHLHYLHLGHCSKITDRLIATLAQHCTRIRYLDLACCSLLTDAALFSLAQLPKLRRIGLVKCTNMTDQGLLGLLGPQVVPQTLERVHLSYCVHLSDWAVARLVRICSKLTHLSLTGVPAFLSRKYQEHCRAPPAEFTPHQREVFCVFSGQGVKDLREFMMENPPVAPPLPPIVPVSAPPTSAPAEASSEAASGAAGNTEVVSLQAPTAGLVEAEAPLLPTPPATASLTALTVPEGAITLPPLPPQTTTLTATVLASIGLGFGSGSGSVTSLSSLSGSSGSPLESSNTIQTATSVRLTGSTVASMATAGNGSSSSSLSSLNAILIRANNNKSKEGQEVSMGQGQARGGEKDLFSGATTNLLHAPRHVSAGVAMVVIPEPVSGGLVEGSCGRQGMRSRSSSLVQDEDEGEDGEEGQEEEETEVDEED